LNLPFAKFVTFSTWILDWKHFLKEFFTFHTGSRSMSPFNAKSPIPMPTIDDAFQENREEKKAIGPY